MELSATPNTESMVKQKLKKKLVHCVTYLHTFMHATRWRLNGK